MANLTARFQLIDQMSQKMADIANNGESMLSKWESAGDAASAALDGISSSASNVAAAADGVAPRSAASKGRSAARALRQTSSQSPSIGTVRQQTRPRRRPTTGQTPSVAMTRQCWRRLTPPKSWWTWG